MDVGGVFVRLCARKTEWRNPFHRFASTGYNLGTFGEPILNLVCICEQVANALDRDLGQVVCSSVEFTVSFKQLAILKLTLDLLTGPNKSDTVH